MDFKVNSIINDIFLGWKLKAFADDKINVNEKLKFVFGRIENMGKGEIAFSPFATVFSKGFFFNVVESRDFVVKT